MAIITFWNNGKVETSQSMTMAAIATTLAINYNYKILMINTKHNDVSLECAFEPKNTANSFFARGKLDLDTGLSGVAKAIMSNKTSPEIITNYTKVIFKNLELLTDKKVSDEDFDRYIKYIKEIIKLANRYFDIVFVDLDGDLGEPNIKQVLSMSNVKVITLVQNINAINEYIEQREKEPILQEENKIISIGKYDKKSKYSVKNVTKYMKEKRVFGIPYNTMFSMDAPEGKVADYIIRFRKISSQNINAEFINSIKNITEEIINIIKTEQRKIY